MTLSRKELLIEFEAALQEWYPEDEYGDEIPSSFGSFEVKFQHGEMAITVRERETRKPLGPIDGAEALGYVIPKSVK